MESRKRTSSSNRSKTRKSSNRRSSNSKRRTSSNSSGRTIASYIATVTKFRDAMNRDDDGELAEKLLALITQAGNDYFSSHRSGYAGVHYADDLDSDVKILNKTAFAEIKREEEGYDDDEPEDEVIHEDEASFDDAFRHSLILDITDVHNPKMVKRPDLLNAANDYILKWSEVQRIHKKLGPNQILLHTDMGGESLFFPVPTA
jgi:hypothetical protein